MSTVNISLPSEHVSFIDRFVAEQGFANRSEFFRALIRLLRQKPYLADDVISHPFVAAPKGQSVREMMADFRATKKYSPAFLKSLEAGLKRRPYFKP